MLQLISELSSQQPLQCLVLNLTVASLRIWKVLENDAALKRALFSVND